jgi:hypothetical protein
MADAERKMLDATSRAALARREPEQMLDQVAFLWLREAESEERVVVVYNVPKRREAPVVIEAALLVRPETTERRRAVGVGR